MTTIKTDYKKVLKVISSCTNIAQLTTAREMINLMSKKYTFSKNDEFFRFMYSKEYTVSRLLEHYIDKKKELLNIN